MCSAALCHGSDGGSARNTWISRRIRLCWCWCGSAAWQQGLGLIFTFTKFWPLFYLQTAVSFPCVSVCSWTWTSLNFLLRLKHFLLTQVGRCFLSYVTYEMIPLFPLHVVALWLCQYMNCSTSAKCWNFFRDIFTFVPNKDGLQKCSSGHIFTKWGKNLLHVTTDRILIRRMRFSLNTRKKICTSFILCLTRQVSHLSLFHCFPPPRPKIWYKLYNNAILSSNT